MPGLTTIMGAHLGNVIGIGVLLALLGGLIEALRRRLAKRKRDD